MSGSAALLAWPGAGGDIRARLAQILDLLERAVLLAARRGAFCQSLRAKTSSLLG